MPHIHDKIDFTASAYIVYEGKVLLVNHKNLGIWMQLGGHVELDETPDQALLREIREECGVEVEIIDKIPAGLNDSHHTMLRRPDGVSLFKYGDLDHYHVDLTYYARAKSDRVRLEKDAHHDIRWFSESDLDDPEYKIKPVIRHYAREAIKRSAR